MASDEEVGERVRNNKTCVYGIDAFKFYFRTLPLRCEAARWPLTDSSWRSTAKQQPYTITTRIFKLHFV
uniref:Uncharacterized protein n=1 Tax=Strigamia maritima TaxID=126957 RepID=T1IRD5_STRMM